jgi:hypothetical protein
MTISFLASGDFFVGSSFDFYSSIVSLTKLYFFGWLAEGVFVRSSLAGFAFGIFFSAFYL